MQLSKNICSKNGFEQANTDVIYDLAFLGCELLTFEVWGWPMIGTVENSYITFKVPEIQILWWDVGVYFGFWTHSKLLHFVQASRKCLNPLNRPGWTWPVWGVGGRGSAASPAPVPGMGQAPLLWTKVFSKYKTTPGGWFFFLPPVLMETGSNPFEVSGGCSNQLSNDQDWHLFCGNGQGGGILTQFESPRNPRTVPASREWSSTLRTTLQDIFLKLCTAQEAVSPAGNIGEPWHGSIVPIFWR